jgi:RND family efflux transporter MFP subunit
MDSNKQDKCLIFETRFKFFYFIWQLLIVYCLIGNSVLAESIETQVPTEQNILPVSVKYLKDIVLSSKYSTPATVVSLNHPTLSAEITARVKKIHVDIGDRVQYGEVLLSLDCRDYHYRLQQAKVNIKVKQIQIDLLKKDYQRDEHLAKQANISQSRFDSTVSAYQAAQAELESLQAQQSLAQLQVTRCQITAPFAGEITQRQVQIGQFVTNNTPLFNLLQFDNLQISAKLTQNVSNEIKVANGIYFINRNGVNTKVRLSKKIAFFDEKTHTQIHRFTPIANGVAEHQALIAGTTGRLHWMTTQKKLPAKYLSNYKNQLGIFVLESYGKFYQAKFIFLKEAQEGRDSIINLPLDTAIIDQGRLSLQPQQVVRLQ